MSEEIESVGKGDELVVSVESISSKVRLENLSVRNVGTLLQAYLFMLVLAILNFSLIVALYVFVDGLGEENAAKFLDLAKAYALVDVSIITYLLCKYIGV